jgi:hypothetical protein
MNNDIQVKFASYPKHVRPHLLVLRGLILELAEHLKLGRVEETLKWGEPSYLVDSGSPVRIDWKAKNPNHYFLFFHCQTKLVDTFRLIYSDNLVFQGNRAIVLDLNGQLPESSIKHCIELALTYKKRKHLPLLGI